MHFSTIQNVEVMLVFERPYHKKDSNELRSDSIFGVYTYEPYGIS